MSKAVALGSLVSCFGLVVLGACNDESSPTPPSQGGVGGTIGSGGAGGDAPTSGGSGGTGGNDGTGGSPAPTYPPTLHETGLYDGPGETLSEGVREFTPRYPLYSDGAAKRRWIYLPPGTRVDTSDPDYWDFPVGTKLWKEFARDGVRVETRYLEKRQNGRFWRIAYHWNEEQTEAVAVPEGVNDASGTEHDIPSEEECLGCHGSTRGEVLGFSAIQLAYDSEHFDAADLVAEDRVSEPVAASLELPGSAQDRDALGYLHVNCGTCHNPTSPVRARVNMDLRLRVGSLGSVGETPIAQTSFGVGISLRDGTQPDVELRIAPGSAEDSAVFLRMDSRGELYSMPPLGTELVDEDGSALIRAWIDAMQ